jgi:hypothetical protein
MDAQDGNADVDANDGNAADADANDGNADALADADADVVNAADVCASDGNADADADYGNAADADAQDCNAADADAQDGSASDADADDVNAADAGANDGNADADADDGNAADASADPEQNVADADAPVDDSNKDADADDVNADPNVDDGNADVDANNDNAADSSVDPERNVADVDSPVDEGNTADADADDLNKDSDANDVNAADAGGGNADADAQDANVDDDNADAEDNSDISRIPVVSGVVKPRSPGIIPSANISTNSQHLNLIDATFVRSSTDLKHAPASRSSQNNYFILRSWCDEHQFNFYYELVQMGVATPSDLILVTHDDLTAIGVSFIAAKRFLVQARETNDEFDSRKSNKIRDIRVAEIQSDIIQLNVMLQRGVLNESEHKSMRGVKIKELKLLLGAEDDDESQQSHQIQATQPVEEVPEVAAVPAVEEVPEAQEIQEPQEITLPQVDAEPGNQPGLVELIRCNPPSVGTEPPVALETSNLIAFSLQTEQLSSALQERIKANKPTALATSVESAQSDPVALATSDIKIAAVMVRCFSHQCSLTSCDSGSCLVFRCNRKMVQRSTSRSASIPRQIRVLNSIAGITVRRLSSSASRLVRCWVPTLSMFSHAMPFVQLGDMSFSMPKPINR